MPQIHALLVGINAYPVAPLTGCINDVKAMEAYLKKTYDGPTSATLRIKLLTDEETVKPTRANIIKSFSFFDEAKSGDVCLFYYSGHGSFTKAPEAFWTERDGYLESFVCMDSRLPGGRDLVNKEMGFLIAKALDGKEDVKFVAITDCCHSGTITKALTENKRTDRSCPADFTPKKLENYLGYGETVNKQPFYKEETIAGKQRVTAQQSAHIHLAASQDNQTAKELKIDGKQHGAFTYSLLKTLYGNQGKISYAKLLASARVQVHNLVQSQDPVLNLNGGLGDEHAKTDFLLGAVSKASGTYPVFWDNKAGWCIGAGPIHGASVGDVVVIENVCQTKIIDQPFPHLSVLMDKPQMNKSHSGYEALLYVQPAQKVKVAFARGLPTALTAKLHEAYDQLKPEYVELIEGDQAKYYIRNHAEGVYTALPAADVPLFNYTTVDTEDSAVRFWQKIATVSNWLHLLEVENPASLLSSKEYQIEIKQLMPSTGKPGVGEEVKDLTKPIELLYSFDEGKLKQPSIQVMLTNKSARDLWFSCLFMGFDFSISGSALKELRLAPGRSAALTSFDRQGNETDVLKLKVDSTLVQKGYNDITEYLKFFVSTSALDTSRFSQEGLELAPVAKSIKTARGNKGLGEDEEEDSLRNDWKTETIALHIVRPKEAIDLPEGVVTNVNGILIEVPAAFSARACLTSSGQFAATSKTLAPHQRNRNTALEPFPLLPQTRAGDVVDLLELLDIQNAAGVTAQSPLKIQLPSERSTAASSVIPLGLDVESGLYFPVGYVDSDNKIRIEQLPQQTPATSAINAKSLLASIKIYFQKVINNSFGAPNPYPQLAVATITDGALTYERSKSKILEAVDKAESLVLMIHGIIGDTKGMAQSLHMALGNQGSLPENKIDLFLAFDYENLNTSIPETARLLKEKLVEVGLPPGHNKKLVIVAHSMGGLVSRWLIEKEGGAAMVSHLVMYGTPNNGTPWADVRDMAQAIITYGVNGAAFLQPWFFILSGVGKLAGGTQITLKEMDADTGIYAKLNDGNNDPGIGYTIISGNTQDIIPDYLKTASLISRILSKTKRGSYKLLDTVLFRKPNDIAASVESVRSIPGSEKWKIKPSRHTVACDHLTYFSTQAALKYLQVRDKEEV